MLMLVGGWQISLRSGAPGNGASAAGGTGAVSLEEGYKAPAPTTGAL